MKHSDIESISIHPSIGIARIGNAPDAFFYAPDVCGATPIDKNEFRDEKGKIKRQAARFRVYATLKTGEIREITNDDARITWRVEVANLKAGWYQFNYPMDVPPSEVKQPTQRNANIKGSERSLLDIRPTPKEITGPSESGSQYHLDDGTFFEKTVYLGELRTDTKGRLVFLGGRGNSNPRVAGTPPNTFANNDGWHDDTSDGPVRATVKFDDVEIEATPAYVVVAPPNYAPGLFGVVTMNDVVCDLYQREGWIPVPDKTSFKDDIWPIFDRQTGHQWVNDGIFLIAGQGTPLDARDPTVVAKLADNTTTGEAFRRAVFELFRSSNPKSRRPDALPPFYGDTTGDRVYLSRAELLLTETQYNHLQNWVVGKFVSDWTTFPDIRNFDDISSTEQPEELDRSALYECLGGPFHPGIELTWPMRLATMWDTAYRLKTLPEGYPVKQDYGPELTQTIALAPEGPHSASGPGSLTRWMGVPWQTDEASCNSGLIYDPSLYLSTPSFWGARVPNQVLPGEAFEIAESLRMNNLQAQRHFSNRKTWLRDINGQTYNERINNMVSRWWEIGMLVAKSPTNTSLPNPCYVETGRSNEFTAGDPTLKLALDINSLNNSGGDGLTLSSGVDDRSEKHPMRDSPTFGRGEI